MVCQKCGEPNCRAGGVPNCRNCGWPEDYRGPLSRGRPRGDRVCEECDAPTYLEPDGSVVCGVDPRHQSRGRGSP